jgi:hypothetical protein
MSNPKDKPAPPPPSDPPGGDKRSGRVGFDERGNSVWEWQLETGVYSRDISTQKLRKLDLNELSIADTASHKRPGGLGSAGGTKAPAPMPGGGFNPYDNSAPAGSGFNPYDNAHALGRKVQAPPPAPKPMAKPVAAAPAKKPVDLKKLEEWIQLKKRLAQQKDDD